MTDLVLTSSITKDMEERKMKYPIDIEDFIAECNAMYPDNPHADTIFRAVLPMVNEAYEQGRKDEKEGVK